MDKKPLRLTFIEIENSLKTESQQAFNSDNSSDLRFISGNADVNRGMQKRFL
jgi:hypothetical protein